MFRTSYKNMTASGQVLAGEGWIAGYLVNNVSTGYFKLLNGLTGTAAAITGTIACTAGDNKTLFNVHCTTGCFVVWGGSESMNVTFFPIENAN